MKINTDYIAKNLFSTYQQIQQLQLLIEGITLDSMIVTQTSFSDHAGRAPEFGSYEIKQVRHRPPPCS